MLEVLTVNERRACRLAGLSRDAFRHPPEPALATRALSARIIELAQVPHRAIALHMAKQLPSFYQACAKPDDRLRHGS